MRDWVSGGVAFVGIVLLLVAAASMIRWLLTRRGGVTKRPDGRSWAPLGSLGTALIQLAGVISGGVPWWRPIPWLLLAVVTGARTLAWRRSGGLSQSHDGTSIGASSGE